MRAGSRKPTLCSFPPWRSRVRHRALPPIPPSVSSTPLSPFGCFLSENIHEKEAQKTSDRAVSEWRKGGENDDQETKYIKDKEAKSRENRGEILCDALEVCYVKRVVSEIRNKLLPVTDIDNKQKYDSSQFYYILSNFSYRRHEF